MLYADYCDRNVSKTRLNVDYLSNRDFKGKQFLLLFTSGKYLNLFQGIFKERGG